MRGARDLPLNIGGYQLPSTARLELQKTSRTLGALEVANLTHVPTGNGMQFMLTMAVSSPSPTFLEGCFHAYAPPDQAFPGTVLSTGTEDYFDSGWDFASGLYRGSDAGLTHFNLSDYNATDGYNTLAGNVSWSAYRIHDQDVRSQLPFCGFVWQFSPRRIFRFTAASVWARRVPPDLAERRHD